MANPEHLAILKQGVEAWNKWREENPEVRWPDLYGAYLHGEDFSGINFNQVNLNHTNLEGVVLSKANLTFAQLKSANLTYAELIEADLSVATIEARLINANLTRANLKEVSLHGSNLGGAQLVEANLAHSGLGSIDLRHACLDRANLSCSALVFACMDDTELNETNFRDVTVGATLFGNVNLSTAKGLETVRHDGPSTMGIDTIVRSGGNIPESFLRGCGVPETFITYARSLVGKPINFYSCFISHSSKDKRFCERLYADLQANGVRVWYLPEDAKWGEPLWGEIDRSIHIYDKLIFVSSRNAWTSMPVQREIERALNREDKEHKNILFPITIDDYLFDEWEHPRKADVLAKVVGDFCGWNRNADKYAKAFRKFLKALTQA